MNMCRFMDFSNSRERRLCDPLLKVPSGEGKEWQGTSAHKMLLQQQMLGKVIQEPLVDCCRGRRTRWRPIVMVRYFGRAYARRWQCSNTLILPRPAQTLCMFMEASTSLWFLFVCRISLAWQGPLRFLYNHWLGIAIDIAKTIAFKGDNGYYLRTRAIEGHPYLEFASSDIGDPTVGNEAFTTHDGSVLIKSDSGGAALTGYGLTQMIPPTTTRILCFGPLELTKMWSLSATLVTTISVIDLVLTARPAVSMSGSPQFPGRHAWRWESLFYQETSIMSIFASWTLGSMTRGTSWWLPQTPLTWPKNPTLNRWSSRIQRLRAVLGMAVSQWSWVSKSL